MLDGIPADEMTQEQLVEHLGRIKEELDREREERNFFQLERDKIHTFWEITRRQLEERRAELRNKDREMEEAEERHQVTFEHRILMEHIYIICSVLTKLQLMYICCIRILNSSRVIRYL